MKASGVSFKVATLLALCGIGMGIAMAASGDHSVMPAHAHLNLLGWVSLFLFGIYYKLNPAVDGTRLSLIQIGTWTLGTIVLTIGVTAVHLGNPEAEPVAALGSLIVLAGMALFAYLVFRPDTTAQPSSPVFSPAE